MKSAPTIPVSVKADDLLQIWHETNIILGRAIGKTTSYPTYKLAADIKENYSKQLQIYVEDSTRDAFLTLYFVDMHKTLWTVIVPAYTVFYDHVDQVLSFAVSIQDHNTLNVDKLKDIIARRKESAKIRRK